jgi:hypothetical protein
MNVLLIVCALFTVNLAFAALVLREELRYATDHEHAWMVFLAQLASWLTAISIIAWRILKGHD